MATEAAPQTNGDVPNFKIVSRLDGVPAIHDSVTYAQSMIQSYGLTAKLYGTAVGIANKSYEVATPILTRTKPILESADGLAVATFDRAEATFPYPFKTPTQDLVVVKQAKAVYDERLYPYFARAQPVLHDVLVKTSQINEAIGARAVATLHSSQEVSHALLEQLKALAEQGQHLPAVLLDGVTKATTDIKDIVLAKDATLQEKSNKLGAYVIDQVKPVVDSIYDYVLAGKKKAEEEANKAGEQVNGQ